MRGCVWKEYARRFLAPHRLTASVQTLRVANVEKSAGQTSWNLSDATGQNVGTMPHMLAFGSDSDKCEGRQVQMFCEPAEPVQGNLTLRFDVYVREDCSSPWSLHSHMQKQIIEGQNEGGSLCTLHWGNPCVSKDVMPLWEDRFIVDKDFEAVDADGRNLFCQLLRLRVTVSDEARRGCTVLDRVFEAWGDGDDDYVRFGIPTDGHLVVPLPPLRADGGEPRRWDENDIGHLNYCIKLLQYPHAFEPGNGGAAGEDEDEADYDFTCRVKAGSGEQCRVFLQYAEFEACFGDMPEYDDNEPDDFEQARRDFEHLNCVGLRRYLARLQWC